MASASRDTPLGWQTPRTGAGARGRQACDTPRVPRQREACGRHAPGPNASLPASPGRPFSFLPNRRPMDDLMPFFLGALWSESWLLLLLLGLLTGPSCEPVELRGQKTTLNKRPHRVTPPPCDLEIWFECLLLKLHAGAPSRPRRQDRVLPGRPRLPGLVSFPGSPGPRPCSEGTADPTLGSPLSRRSSALGWPRRPAQCALATAWHRTKRPGRSLRERAPPRRTQWTGSGVGSHRPWGTGL